MGCIYTGIANRHYRNGVFKIGQTKDKYPTGRLNANGLSCIYYLSVPNATGIELDLLEAFARYTCQEIGLSPQYSDTKDWFRYNIDKRFTCQESQAERFAIAVMQRLIQECQQMGIKYEIRACYLKGKRYTCSAAKVLDVI